MKNSILSLSFITFGLLLCGFQQPNIELQEILQNSLEVQELEAEFKKDDTGRFLRLTIITNQFFSKNIHLKYAGQSVKILDKVLDNNTEQSSILEITSLKLKAKKSIIRFKYNGKTIKIRLKKKNNEWYPYAVMIHKKGTFSYTSRTEF